MAGPGGDVPVQGVEFTAATLYQQVRTFFKFFMSAMLFYYVPAVITGYMFLDFLSVIWKYYIAQASGFIILWEISFSQTVNSSQIICLFSLTVFKTFFFFQRFAVSRWLYLCYFFLFILLGVSWCEDSNISSVLDSCQPLSIEYSSSLFSQLPSSGLYMVPSHFSPNFKILHFSMISSV